MVKQTHRRLTTPPRITLETGFRRQAADLRSPKPRSVNPLGFTLIEVLCTIAIILVLATLVLGPASRVLQRVRADQWGERASTRLEATVEQLRKQLVGQPAFGVVTLERIERNRWVGPVEADFLRDRRVTFIPFADSDPDEKVVIRVRVDRGFWTDAEIRTRRKVDLTSAPQ